MSPLALYVHWPYCARICPYCDFNVVRDRGRSEEQAALVQAILADLEGHRALTGPRRLGSVFFGGGTPSRMEPAFIATILEAATRLWSALDDLEVTLEANPGDAERARYAAFAAAGVNRLSLGLQALDDQALILLGRDHDAAAGMQAVEAAVALFRRVSIDLIYARPGQTVEAWAAELEAAVALGAEHISPYQLTLEPGTAFHRAAERGRFEAIDPDLGAALFETTQVVLSAEGFDAYEVSNHARGEAARSRHNLAIWRGADYAGVGPGAHGRLTVEDRRLATLAAKRPTDYVAQVRRTGLGFDVPVPLDPREAAQERLLLGLRIAEGARFADLAPLALTPDSETVTDLVTLGLIASDRSRLRATAAGRPVLDRLIAELAA